MMEYRNVIVLQDARAVRDSLVQELAKWDFAVRSCGSLQGFRHLYALHPSPLVVLTGEPGDLARHTENARAAAPLATIVALCTAADPNWRVRIMASGADACHMASIQGIELAAILSSWARHAARADRLAQETAQTVHGNPRGDAFARSAFHDDKAARAAFHGDSAAHPAEYRTVRKGNGRKPGSGRASMARFIHQQSAQSFESHKAGHRGDSHAPGRPANSGNPRQSGSPSQSGNSGNSDNSGHPSDSGHPGNSSNYCHPGKSDNSETALDHAGIAAPGGQAERHSGRYPARPAGPGLGWCLDASCRVLICPRGGMLLLTCAENGFLMRIATSDGQLLRRHQTANAATRNLDHGGTGNLDMRGMDVLVSRLRRKARREGMELPLLSVRACGYLFAEYLGVAPSRPVRPAAPSSRIHLLPADATSSRPPAAPPVRIPVQPPIQRSIQRPVQPPVHPAVHPAVQPPIQPTARLPGAPVIPPSDLSTSEVSGVSTEALATVSA